MDLLWLSTGDMWLCGPETAAWTFELPSHVSAVGVRFRPGLASAVWGVDASALRNRRVSWRDVVGEVAERALIDAISTASTDHARIGVLENCVAARVMVLGGRAVDPVADSVIEHLAANPRGRATAIAADCGLTTRQLLRRCQVAFGYGVSTLARIMRVMRFASIVEFAPPGRSLAELAHDAGYSDQAHLVHDCRELTGLTPRQFLLEWQPTFPDMSDPYKTEAALFDKLRR